MGPPVPLSVQELGLRQQAAIFWPGPSEKVEAARIRVELQRDQLSRRSHCGQVFANCYVAVVGAYARPERGE